jgi:hypothetical protein
MDVANLSGKIEYDIGAKEVPAVYFRNGAGYDRHMFGHFIEIEGIGTAAVNAGINHHDTSAHPNQTHRQIASDEAQASSDQHPFSPIGHTKPSAGALPAALHSPRSGRLPLRRSRKEDLSGRSKPRAGRESIS